MEDALRTAVSLLYAIAVPLANWELDVHWIAIAGNVFITYFIIFILMPEVVRASFQDDDVPPWALLALLPLLGIVVYFWWPPIKLISLHLAIFSFAAIIAGGLMFHEGLTLFDPKRSMVARSVMVSLLVAGGIFKQFGAIAFFGDICHGVFVVVAAGRLYPGVHSWMSGGRSPDPNNSHLVITLTIPSAFILAAVQYCRFDIPRAVSMVEVKGGWMTSLMTQLFSYMALAFHYVRPYAFLAGLSLGILSTLTKRGETAR